MNTVSSKPQNARFDFVDLLKGFGIFLVVWGHTMTPRSIYIYSFHMPLFFFLSGYVHKKKPFQEFLLTKFNSLYVPYMTFSLFSWLFYLVQHLSYGRTVMVSTHLPKIQSIFTGTAENGGNNPIWFLTCIFIISLIFYFIEVLLKQPYLKWGVIFTLSVVGFSLGTEFQALFQIDVALTGLVFYSLGHAVRNLNLLQLIDGLNTFRLIGFILLCELIHVISAYYNVDLTPIRWVNMAGNVIGSYMLFYLSAISGITVFLVIGYKLRFVKLFNYLGLHTLAILGFHKPILQLFESIFTSLVDTNHWFYGIVTSVAAIVLALLLGQLLNRLAPTLMGKKPLIQPLVKTA